MKKVYILFFLVIFFSCKKNEPDYAMEFVGVYNAKEVHFEGEVFPLLIDKIDDNTILIETKVFSSQESFNANIDEYDFVIPSQVTSSGFEFRGNGNLNGNNLIMYYIVGNLSEKKVIATK